MLVNLYPNVSICPTTSCRIKSVNSLDHIYYGDSVFFSGSYNNVFNEVINYDIKNLDEALKCLKKLFSSISEDDDIVKTPYFDIINLKCEQKGVKGLLHILQFNSETGKFNELYKNLYKNQDNYENGIILAYKNDKPILLFDDLNRIYSDKSEKNQPFFTFRSLGDEQFEFLKNKKEIMSCCQTLKDLSIETIFHKFSKNRQKLIINTPYSQDVTYYNKDGSKSFLKNWFLGGSTPIPR